MPYRKQFSILSFLLLCVFSSALYAQPTWTFEPFGKEKKPEQYEEKLLPSEKTNKKFTTFRRFLQNTTTHYNYFFNATNKLNAVLERAKMSNQDDYSKLLSFYPYSLDNTASQQVELDSVIYKSTAAILLHDLRSDWVDNMYLLIGKAYYFRKEFDSAALTFQFINYNLFPRKKHEDDNRIVGENQSAKSSVISIANPEKRNVVQKVTSRPPSRNDALVWLARTFIDQKEYGDAAGMINILNNDPNLPKRLRNDMEEVNAYWFYMQENYDSSAAHLEKALSNADTKQDKSRWEFLLAQMYDMTGNYDKATDYYAKAAKHTVDPVMDIFARLNSAKMFKDKGNTRELDNSIARLLKMARKDRFEAYRDVIYYSAAEMSLQKPDTTKAKPLYLKSVKYNAGNTAYRNKAFLQLGNIAYDQRQYKLAASYYDSLQLNDPSILAQAEMINARKNSLSNIVAQVNIIEREDSLQKVAAMPAAERDALIRKLVKKYRKENGIKEEDNSGGTMITFNNNSDQGADLFATNSKGEWYFYNATAKSRGYNDFKSKWGKRDNVDNWRRKAAMAQGLNANSNIDIDRPPTDPIKDGAGKDKPAEYSYEAFMENLPLTPEKIDSSNATIAKSLVTLAKLFRDELEDYEEAINTYDNYLQRFPDKYPDPEVYLGMYICYSKLGNTAKADYYKNLLNTKFAGSDAAKLLSDPAALKPNEKNPEATKRYAAIYDLFIEGKFAEAVDAKKRADSVYGKNYWTPQLLYIEAVNYIRERNDSTATDVLKNIIALYPKSPLKPKAENMIEVLKRRAEIETYLTNLQVTRAEEDKIFINDTGAVVVEKAKPIEQPAAVKQVTVPVVKPVIKQDSLQLPASMVSGAFRWQADKPHVVVIMLDKVDAVYVNEAKNAFDRYNREKYYSKQLQIKKDAIDAQRTLLVFQSFTDATDAYTYFEKLKKAAPAEISWLQPNKYSFLVISADNLELLKSNKDVNAYKTLLNNQYPGKF
ncbi:MAG: tetratricopeptide repeat protein [Bacteroidetes bacterium]|nr:tetratricopeptide repeat protein [Bacteroidota bacterium]